MRQWKATERETAGQLLERQTAQLRRHLIWACHTCEYYREAASASGFAPEKLRSMRDLEQLPILGKRNLNEQATRLMPGGTLRPEWRANASGGSTGEPVRLYQDAGYWDASQAAQTLMEGWWGVKPGEPTAVVWGADRDLALRSRRERLVAAIAQTRWLNAFQVEEAVLNRFVTDLARWQPSYVIGYASALSLLARYLQARPEIAVRPRAVKSTAEVLLPAERRVIEQVFQAPVYDFYGSREVNVLAAECPAHAGLHVNCWSRVIELVDGEGRAVPPGVPGRVLVTDLTNHATAIIRYENGDVAEWSPTPCPCGRPFPLLARIVGRKSDFIRTPAGRLIHGEFFTHLFYDQPQVVTFQAVQPSLRQLRIDVVLRDGTLRDLGEQLRPRLQASLGTDMVITFEQRAAIARPESGKHRFTVSEVEAGWPGGATP